MTEALAQARVLLDELTEAARKGAIIPVHLPQQLEAIGQLLAQVGSECAGSTAPPDQAAFLTEQAAFMSHAIHELRTPMTSIRGYADMLATPGMGELSTMQQQFLTTIRVNTRRMEGLLQDVSDISKLRAGSLRVNLKMDTFKNIALMVEKQTRPLAEELGRELIFDIPQGLPILNTDGEMLTKALVKLVENALRYTPQEGGRVMFSASTEGRYVCIRIQDNGIGMTPDEIAQLGTLYFRGDHDAVRSHKGSGMGIPIAYGILALFDGQIEVRSQPDQGTTFTVMLAGMT
ncbi:MAG: HAMP domain-containing histidine kinase [Chloroflexi bacterium]|nr:HAMP domain-containing histidine kinase [Chloroflexota bacterium]